MLIKKYIIIVILVFIFKSSSFSFSQTHIVQPKETLYSISKKYGFKVEDFTQVNNLSEPYIIHPGDILKIPEKHNLAKDKEYPVSQNDLPTEKTTKNQTETLENKKPDVEISQASFPTKTGKRNYLVIANTVAFIVSADKMGNPLVVGYVPQNAQYQLIKEVGEYYQVKHLFYGEVYIWKKQSFKVLETKSISKANSAEVLKFAALFYGVPYLWGGSSPSAFDCSGFTQYVFAHFGIKIPRISKDQFLVGEPISFDNLYGGDLLFFGNVKEGVNHVGIYWGGGYFIHASSGKGGVVFTHISESYYSKNLIGAKRIVTNNG